MAAAPGGEADEENVLGIPVADPDVLKATQVVLVSVAVTAFVLALNIIRVIEQKGLQDLNPVEEILWLLDCIRAVLMSVSGYVGVRKGSAALLALFWILSVASVLTTVGVAVGAVVRGSEGNGAQQLLVAVLFGAGAYHSWFLWGKAANGSLFSAQTGGSGRDSYIMLGIPMMDLKVLRATQMLFTAQAIIIYTFGSVIVIGADDAISSASFRHFWLFCVAIVSSLSFTSYYGIKRSSPSLLRAFCGICAVFCGLSGLTTFLTVMTCGLQCAALDLFSIGITAAFAVALRNGWYLMMQASSGKALAAVDVEATTGNVAPTQLGAPIGGEAAKGEAAKGPREDV